MNSITGFSIHQPFNRFVLGPRFFSNKKNSVHLSESNREKIGKVFLNVANARCQSPYETTHYNPLLIIATETLKRELPSEIIEKIEEVKNSTAGFLEITGTPIDPHLMDTPTSGEKVKDKKQTYVAEMFSMGIAGLAGQEIYNFRQEAWGSGEPIFNIFPKPEMLSIKGAGGALPNFRFHMENAWHTQTPDSLILKGLRQDHDAAAITYVIANQIIYDHLDQEDREILTNGLYKISPPEIHRKMESEKGIIFSEDDDYIGPVIVKEDTGIKLMINFNGMSSFNTQADKTLKKIEKLIQGLATEVKLKEDNLIFLNNKRALHTRNGYKPRFDGKDRWFQRYYLSEPSRLWRSVSLEPSHFPFLTIRESEDLLNYLDLQGITINNKLSSKFMPHDPEFKMILPFELEQNRIPIMKVLLRNGPAYPHRIV